MDSVGSRLHQGMGALKMGVDKEIKCCSPVVYGYDRPLCHAQGLQYAKRYSRYEGCGVEGKVM